MTMQGLLLRMARLVSLTSTIQTSPASAQSCVDSGTASQCADFAKSFNCYDDMGAQCRALHGATSTNPSSCVQLTGVKMTDLCCGTCASCGDFHWQCETEYSQHAGCNEDLGVVCRELLGPNDAATGCGQLNSRLVKLDCCRSCRLVEASDVPTLMRMECNADEALRKKYNADYAAGFNTLKNTNGCSEQALHDPLGHWPRLPVVCRQGLCSAWFATYAPGCSCFTDKRDTATALKERCSDTLWGASLYGGLDLGGQADLCANFAFVAGRVRETDLPMSNADEIFAVKKKLAGIFQVDTYTRYFWITEAALVNPSDVSLGWNYKLVIGIGSRRFLEATFVPGIGALQWTAIEYYNMEGPMPLGIQTSAPNSAGDGQNVMTFPTTTTSEPPTSTTATPGGSGDDGDSSDGNSTNSSTSAGSAVVTSTSTSTTTTTLRAAGFADFQGLLAQIMSTSEGSGVATSVAAPLPQTVSCRNPTNDGSGATLAEGGRQLLELPSMLSRRKLEEQLGNYTISERAFEAGGETKAEGLAAVQQDILVAFQHLVHGEDHDR